MLRTKKPPCGGFFARGIPDESALNPQLLVPKRRPDIRLNLLIYIVIKYVKAIFIPTIVPKSKALPSGLTSVPK
jgi:hypothetical protein